MIVAKIHNTTINPQSGFKPAELVFGKGAPSNSYLDLEKITPPHHLIKNKKEHIQQLTKELTQMSILARERLTKLRELTSEKLNKNRVDKGLKENDYVFVLDRTEIPGATRPLKTKLDPSPYVVLSVKYTTVLVRRLSDSFTSLYSMDDVKKYDASSPLFADLPKEVAKVLLHDFTDLLSEDFTTLMKHDTLSVPTGLPITEKTTHSSGGNKSPTEEELEREYDKALEQELILKDLLELEKDKTLRQKVPEIQKEPDSESEEENEDDNNQNWKNRLRPRQTKISFSPKIDKNIAQ
jgi:hypothetical protein